jgi:hypothetical protein
MNHPIEPLRAAPPAPVLNAVKLMYAAADPGAASSAFFRSQSFTPAARGA